VDEDNQLAAIDAETVKARLTVNRLVCAFSGPLGKYLAKGADALLTAVNAEPTTREKVRMVLGQGGAFVLTTLGAPEGALAVLSSMGSHGATPEQPSAAVEVETTGG